MTLKGKIKFGMMFDDGTRVDAVLIPIKRTACTSALRRRKPCFICGFRPPIGQRSQRGLVRFLHRIPRTFPSSLSPSLASTSRRIVGKEPVLKLIRFGMAQRHYNDHPGFPNANRKTLLPVVASMMNESRWVREDN